MEITDQHIQEHRWFNYLDFYTTVAENPDFKIYVELGCWKGHSTAFLADKIKHKEGAKLWAVDYWDPTITISSAYLPDDYPHIYDIYDENMKRSGARHIVTDIKGCTWEAAEQFEDESVDFIYIDADHSEPGVTKDIYSWWPKLKPTGLMAGHDYHPDNKTGVGPAVRKIFNPNEFEDVGRTVWQVWKSNVNRSICGI
jgi:predicted O-methyltransferase YrrM